MKKLSLILLLIAFVVLAKSIEHKVIYNDFNPHLALEGPLVIKTEVNKQADK